MQLKGQLQLYDPRAARWPFACDGNALEHPCAPHSLLLVCSFTAVPGRLCCSRCPVRSRLQQRHALQPPVAGIRFTAKPYGSSCSRGRGRGRGSSRQTRLRSVCKDSPVGQRRCLRSAAGHSLHCVRDQEPIVPLLNTQALHLVHKGLDHIAQHWHYGLHNRCPVRG